MKPVIPFNKPYFTGKETEYIQQGVASGHISGDGMYTRKCHEFFEKKYGFKKCLLTTSCTDAIEMAAILMDIGEGDEVIVPGFTFVSTANAFVLRGAKIVFADSMDHHPNINADAIEPLITSRTKAIVPVHYAGMACDMDKIIAIAKKHNLFVVEDAAQAVDSFYRDKPLGGIGHFGTFSFHETKNIMSGEGGMLVINDERFIKRAEIIREKGTNRSAFFRNEVDKYNWVDIGSSFLPSDIVAAILYAQLEKIEFIQSNRKKAWEVYYENLKPLEEKGYFSLPEIPSYSSNNAHIFYLVCNNENEKNDLIDHLKANGVHAVFHYQSLHKSPFYSSKSKSTELPHCERFSKTLVRLPLFVEITAEMVKTVCDEITAFYEKK
ncbi:MAG: dTDP-4-amino-4,6-dideoxygalactose transaminase [Bacteroidota bacterium]